MRRKVRWLLKPSHLEIDMPTRYNTTLRNARLSAILTEAGASALIELYDGAQPATLGGAPAGNLLVEATGDATAFGTVASGVLTGNTIVGDTSANNSGTPTWCRIKKSGGTVVADVPVSGMPAAVAGQSYDITTLTITEGNA